MRRLRLAMDPVAIANRGKMLAVGRPPALACAWPAPARAGRHHLTRMTVIAEPHDGDVQARLRARGGAAARASGRSAGTKTALVPGATRAVSLDLAASPASLEYQPAGVHVHGAGRDAGRGDRRRAGRARTVPAVRSAVRLRGATIGGTVAAGAERTWPLSLRRHPRFPDRRRVVDGEGRLMRSGGKVVKNAAGFLPAPRDDRQPRPLRRARRDLTFKVFPRARPATLRVPFQNSRRADRSRLASCGARPRDRSTIDAAGRIPVVGTAAGAAAAPRRAGGVPG